MTMLPHLTAQTQLQQQKSITKLICVKNLNLKRHEKFYCIFCGHLKNLEVFTSRRTSRWQLAWKWRHDILRETPHVLQMTSKNEAKKSGIGMCRNAHRRRRRLSEWDTHRANNNCMMYCSVLGEREGRGWGNFVKNWLSLRNSLLTVSWWKTLRYLVSVSESNPPQTHGGRKMHGVYFWLRYCGWSHLKDVSPADMKTNSFWSTQ